MKAFADYKMNATQKIKLFLRVLGNILRKGEMLGCCGIFTFPTMFSQVFLFRFIKVTLPSLNHGHNPSDAH